MRILLVEDDTSFAQGCIESLLRNGYQGDFAPDAVSARRKIAAGNYDLIIIDLMLPPSFGMEGLDLLKQLKLQGRDNPAIMITSKAFKTTNIVSEAMKIGAADFIDKDEPLFMERLLAAVDEMQNPRLASKSQRFSQLLIRYVLVFVAVGTFCLSVAYFLRDFTFKNIVVLSGFLFLCLLVLVFLVASGFLETGRIDKRQWYKIVTEKILSGPLTLIDSLLRHRSDKHQHNANKAIDRGKK